MASNQAFLPMGNAVAVDTNATPATSASALILAGTDVFPSIPNAVLPGMVRIVNTSANIVYIGFSVETLLVAVAPVPGTSQRPFAMLGGTVEVFTLPHGNGKTQCFVNTIAAVGASNRLILSFGEGM